MNDKQWTRRHFVSLGTLAATAGPLPARLLAQGSLRLGPVRARRAASRPGIYSSVGGLLQASLEARQSWVALDGRWVQLFCYNEQFPGPLLEARPGDTVRLRFTNSLPEPTNLHFHGLHVPPTGDADNVFLEVPPRETITYEFALPADHPAGTFWYHPHVHGRAADQLFRGLAGLLIVRGGLDVIPEVASAAERFLVLKDLTLDANGQVPEAGMMDRLMGREGNLVTVNGRINPALPIPGGGMLRLRILNASPSRFYRLQLEGHSLFVIATDGGAIPAPAGAEEILLAPGERAEVLVRGDRPGGLYRLLNLPYHRGGIGMMGSTGGRSAPAQTLATVVYEGFAGSSLDLPGVLVPLDPLPETRLPVRRLVLSSGGVPGRGMSFLINGRTFDHRRVDTQVRLDTIEDWEILNADTMDHPFHLHTNSFQILAGANQPARAWKDVLLVPAGQQRRLRVRFAHYAGKTVYHCHILDHEDLGMMGVVEILPAG